jgi:tetratricopeptide (TPR) repeat protein
MPADLAQAVRQAAIDTGWSDRDARKTAEAALALLEWVGTDSDRLAEATRVTGKDLEDWLAHQHFDLAKAGLVDEAAEVARRAARLSNESMYLGDRAVILAEAGRRDEALAQVEENLRRFPDDVWTKIFAGDAHSALDDDQRAEALWRQALDEADCEYDRLGAFERLEDLLRPAGRDAEADALAERARRRESAPGARCTAALASASADTSGAGATGARKKVGRNDPCPCGSGKKYKKCCGSV